MSGPPSWDQCRYGSLNSSAYENALPMTNRHRQDQPRGNRAEFLSGKFDNQAARTFHPVSNRIGPEDFCSRALEITGNEGFIILRNLCRSLAAIDPIFADTKISPPDVRFLRKNMVFLLLAAKDCYTRLRPEDRHIVKTLHAHINRVKEAYENFKSKEYHHASIHDDNHV